LAKKPPTLSARREAQRLICKTIAREKYHLRAIKKTSSIRHQAERADL
jgi:hypothetical protein